MTNKETTPQCYDENKIEFTKENIKCKTKHPDYHKNYYQQNKETIITRSKRNAKANKLAIRERCKQYYIDNKATIKTRTAAYAKNKLSTDSLYKLTFNIRSLILVSFKKQFTSKSKKTIEILGCSFQGFKIHLEKQFDKNMNWSNHGSYWEMDHIKPISLATNEQEVYELNHYTNFQPLEKSENRRKYNNF